MDSKGVKVLVKQLINQHDLEPDDATDIFKAIIKYIGNSEISAELIKPILDQVLLDYKTQMKVFIVGYTKAKISRLTKVLEYLDKVDEKLYKELEDNNIDKDRLIIIGEILSRRVKETIDLSNAANKLDIDAIQPQVVQNNFLQINNNQTKIEGDALIDIADKDRRMDFRHGLTKILMKVKEDQEKKNSSE